MRSTSMESFEGKVLRETYSLQKYLGEGNFGAVFKGQQSFLGVAVRPVAIKLSKYTNLDIHIARLLFSDAFMLVQAQQEMMDIEAKQHLVHVYDMGLVPEEEDRCFIVMEYIQGTTLAAQFASFRRVPASILLKWVIQICRAMSGLHALTPPLLHRDLKPDNVLLGQDNVLRLVDFGLAARLLYRGFVPGIAGALSHMAPETMMGESIPASDIFSIGVILYEGLTGTHPFANLLSSFDHSHRLRSYKLYQQMNVNRPLPPSYLNNTVSEALDHLVLRCLEFYPNKRYYNARELLKELLKEYNQMLE